MQTPDLVDIYPVPGRRVRNPDGHLLPDGHVLRGEVRSPFWLRLAADGDVTLKPFAPAAPSAPPTKS